MSQGRRSIVLLDDHSAASNIIRLYFSKDPSFSMSRVYTVEELKYRQKRSHFDFIVCPVKHPVWFPRDSVPSDQVVIILYWQATNFAGRSPAFSRLVFEFEIEAPGSSLSWHASPQETHQEQLGTLSRMLTTIAKYHQESARFQADREMFQSVVEESVTGIIHILQNRIRWINHEALRLLGAGEHELEGKEFSSLFADKDRYRETMINISRNRDSGGWGWSPCTLVRKTGEPAECMVRMRRLNPMNAGKGHLVFIDDNRERKRLECTIHRCREQMARNEVQFLDTLQDMNLVIIRTDPDGCIIYWNTHAEKRFGYPASEAAGMTISEMLAVPGSCAQRDINVLLSDPCTSMDHALLKVLEHPTKDGSHLWIAWNTLPCRDMGGKAAGLIWIGQDISDIDSGASGKMQKSWKQQVLEGTRVEEEVFDLLLHTAIELGRGGRESRKIGTSFVIGDSEIVMARSRQCGMNPFEGKDPRQRMVKAFGNIENIKNYAQLDGAFVIDGSGFIHASSRQLLPENTEIDIPEGFGTRHASVAATTKTTRSIGIVVSESGGTVTIFKEGKIVKQIAP